MNHAPFEIPGFVPQRRLLGAPGEESWAVLDPHGRLVAVRIAPTGTDLAAREYRTLKRLRALREPFVFPTLDVILLDEHRRLLPPQAFAQADANLSARPAVADPCARYMAIVSPMPESTLQQRLADCLHGGLPGIPPEELLPYVEAVAYGLDRLTYAQFDLGAGPMAIVHGDLKPANLVFAFGRLMIANLGLARPTDGGNLAVTSVAGTPAYLAPEVIAEKRTTHSTDQYALGIAYYELRTGELPFADELPYNILKAHVQGRLILDRLAPAERQVVAQATARKPEDRFPTCRAFYEALYVAVHSAAATPAAVRRPDPRQAANLAELAEALAAEPLGSPVAPPSAPTAQAAASPPSPVAPTSAAAQNRGPAPSPAAASSTPAAAKRPSTPPAGALYATAAPALGEAVSASAAAPAAPVKTPESPKTPAAAKPAGESAPKVEPPPRWAAETFASPLGAVLGNPELGRSGSGGRGAKESGPSPSALAAESLRSEPPTAQSLFVSVVDPPQAAAPSTKPAAAEGSGAGLGGGLGQTTRPIVGGALEGAGTPVGGPERLGPGSSGERPAPKPAASHAPPPPVQRPSGKETPAKPVEKAKEPVPPAKESAPRPLASGAASAAASSGAASAGGSPSGVSSGAASGPASSGPSSATASGPASGEGKRSKLGDLLDDARRVRREGVPTPPPQNRIPIPASMNGWIVPGAVGGTVLLLLLVGWSIFGGSGGGGSSGGGAKDSGLALAEVAPLSFHAGETLSFSVVDPSKPLEGVVFRWAGEAPAGAELDEKTGDVSWTAPKSAVPGVRSVVVEVERLADRKTARAEVRVELLPPLGPKAGDGIVNSIGMKLVYVPEGGFTMGSPTTESGRDEQEALHPVNLTKGFHLGACEVTEAEYREVMETQPSYFAAEAKTPAERDRWPVERVSHADAVAFCKKLSARDAEQKAGRSYRLPTESEWEYACRAGTSTAFACGEQLSTQHAWFRAPSGARPTTPAETGKRSPNAWGLFDMHGNVYEWCTDWHSPDAYLSGDDSDPTGPAKGYTRVVRGGSYLQTAQQCRSAERYHCPPDVQDVALGFRVVCDSADPKK